MRQTNAVAQERDALAQELRLERAERMKATIAATDAEMSAGYPRARYACAATSSTSGCKSSNAARLVLDQRAEDVEREKRWSRPIA